MKSKNVFNHYVKESYRRSKMLSQITNTINYLHFLYICILTYYYVKGEKDI